MTEQIHYTSSWRLPPTMRQVAAITKLAAQLGIREPIEDGPSNRWEARRLLHELNEKRKATVHKKEQ